MQLLEILVCLQERIPPVIHRDIKPENILVDDDLNVYLIDFGFAWVGSGSVAMSSAGAKTFGFMAPEQIRNLKLSNASDLYGLGLTMICLIGAIRSIDIGNYIDFNNQLDRSKVDPKLKGCSLTFVKWLDQMVAPDPSKRFADAKTALEALKPLYVVRVPEVKFFKDGVKFDPSKDVLEFKATKLGEKLTQTITLVNSIPETILEGHWEVAPHPNDPPHTPDNHTWISFSRKKFEGNKIECQIKLDTSKLIAQSAGKRSILLYSNGKKSNHRLLIKVNTAEIVKIKKEIPLLTLGVCLLGSLLLAYSFRGSLLGSALSGLWGGVVVAVAYNDIWEEKTGCKKEVILLLFGSAALFGSGLGILLKDGVLKDTFAIVTSITSAILFVSTLVFQVLISSFQQRRKFIAYQEREEHLIKP